jgi:hypothetical protein
VFIAVLWSQDGDTILGVYSTREKAEGRLKEHRTYSPRDPDFTVYEWEVDGEEV